MPELRKVAIITSASQGSGHVVNISTSLVDHAYSTRPSVLAALAKGGLAAAARSLDGCRQVQSITGGTGSPPN
jgi:hypothetical protein